MPKRVMAMRGQILIGERFGAGLEPGALWERARVRGSKLRFLEGRIVIEETGRSLVGSIRDTNGLFN